MASKPKWPTYYPRAGDDAKPELLVLISKNTRKIGIQPHSYLIMKTRHQLKLSHPGSFHLHSLPWKESQVSGMSLFCGAFSAQEWLSDTKQQQTFQTAGQTVHHSRRLTNSNWNLNNLSHRMVMLVLSDRDANVQLQKKLCLFTGWIAMKWVVSVRQLSMIFILLHLLKYNIDANKCLMKSIQIGIFQWIKLVFFCSFL